MASVMHMSLCSYRMQRQSRSKCFLSQTTPPCVLKGLTGSASWPGMQVAQEHLDACSRGYVKDVVFLQEVFVEADVSLLIGAAKDGKLQHAHFFNGGMLHGELLLLTAYAIAEAHFHRFAVAGNPSALTHGDYYAGKGVGQAALQTPAGLLNVFNTHTCANYSHAYTGEVQELSCRVPSDSDAAIRISQILQLSRLVQGSQNTGGLGTIVAGDLNCPPDSLEMFIFRALLPDLHDSWEHLHPQQPGFTSNAMDNSFSKPGGDPPCRIDYVWVSGIPDKARLAMQQAQNGCSYSDHLGLEAVCAFHEKDADRISQTSACHRIRQHSRLFSLAQSLASQGAASYQISRRLCVQLALLLLCTGVVAMGVATSLPWWQYYSAVYPVLLCFAAGCLVTAPLCFVLGFAGFGGVAAALREDAEALEICLKGCEAVQAVKLL